VQFIEVAVAAGPVLPRRAGSGLPGVYSYHLEAGQSVEVGWLVEVPFGSRLLPGLVTAVGEEAPDVPTRPLKRVLGDRAAVSERGVELARFIAQTYRAPLFECLLLVLPPGFSGRLKRAQRDGVWTPPRFRTRTAEVAQPSPSTEAPLLSAAQDEAREEILRASAASTSQAFLLYGVTGSGKTLVYLETVARIVTAGRQAIVLASEIGLTPELVQRVRQRVPGPVVPLHSRLPAAVHYQNWCAIADGRARVAIGTRSALFAPAADLGLIVLDEEHEWTYKQENSPRYHAREVALELGRLAQAPVVLSSATPDVETTWRARIGELRTLSLPGRYRYATGVVSEVAQPARNGQAANVSPIAPERLRPAAFRPGLAPLPSVQVVDLRQELREGNTSIFSRDLHQGLGATFGRGEQAILFINRRGTATCVTCRHCGHVVKCRRCEVPLGYHRAGEALVCHRCNRRRPPVLRCPGCGSIAIRHLGVGTQRVEQELALTFPSVRIVRWDRDASQQDEAHEQLWERFRRREADVLIGTQLVTKALDFPFVTLVGVLLADVGLYLPDFRAPERTFQLLTQVAGRAGRAERDGKVIVQTYSPQHYAIRFVAEHDYDGFYEREIDFRRVQGYPPFGRLARFVCSDSDEQRCWRESARLRRLLQERFEKLADPELRLIGPAPCYVQRLRGRYRWQIVVRGAQLAGLLDGLVLPPGWVLDVDPVSVL
jgi:primosomal protein N' (replication factor Y)